MPFEIAVVTLLLKVAFACKPGAVPACALVNRCRRCLVGVQSRVGAGRFAIHIGRRCIA